jgi:maleate isomerase
MREDLSDILEMNANVGKAAGEIASVRPGIVLYGCTGGSFFAGPDYNQRLTEEISAATKCPAVTTSTAVLEALRRLRIKRLALVTPYADALNRAEEEFLTRNGLKVVLVNGLGRYADYDAGTEQDTFQHALHATQSVRDSLDGVFISCTNYPSLGIIERLEQALGLPVVTSNQASIWYTFSRANVFSPIKGYGKLLEC